MGQCFAAILRIRHNAATREAEADGATEHADPIGELLTKIVGKAQRVLAKVHPSQRREAMTTLYAFVVNRCHNTACRAVSGPVLQSTVAGYSLDRAFIEPYASRALIEPYASRTVCE